MGASRSAAEGPGPVSGSPRGSALAAATLALAVLAAYASALPADFVYDDVAVVKENASLRSLSEIPGFFTQSYWRATGARNVPNDLYRPLVLASYAVDYRLWGDRPSGYHLTNVLLHLAVTLLLWLLLRPLALPPGVPLLAALLFGVHAVHTEAVTGIVGRAEVLCTLFGLLSLGAYGVFLRVGADAGRWLFASSVAFALALLSKESAVVVPVLALLVEPLVLAGKAPPVFRLPGGRAAARPVALVLRFAGFALAGGVVIALRTRAIGELGATDRIFERLGIGAADRLLTMAKVFLEYARVQLVPYPLLADHRWNVQASALHAGLAEPRVWLALAVLAAATVAIVSLWRRLPGVSVGIAWFYIALFPVSSLVFPIGVVYTERSLYLPSVGPCLAIATFLALLAARATRDGRPGAPLGLLALPLVCTWGSLTFLRNLDWKNQGTLFADLVLRDPDNPRAYVGLAQAYQDAHDLDRARDAYDHALSLGFGAFSVYANRGMLLYLQGRPDAAEKDFTEALARTPDPTAQAQVLLRRARCRQRQGNLAGAHDDLTLAVRTDPSNPEACDAFGQSWLTANLPQSALEWFEKAILADPARGTAHLHRAETLHALGRLPEALEALEPALALLDAERSGAASLRLLYLVELGRDLASAVPALEAALVSHPALAARALPPLARAHLRLGHEAAARATVGRLLDAGLQLPADLEPLRPR
ncbi:MAG: tetratricopeptide repeat protein [Planctomycetes bacterium]|nr:tetratricopeptide repeat protein [Planctomycetota bacterium]